MGIDDQEHETNPQALQEPIESDASEENGDEGGGPPPITPPEAPDWLYKSIKDVSKNAAKVYLVYMGFLAYAALTAVSTTDRGLILNDKAHLPLVNIDVSANGFFIVAPLMIILIWLYLQLYIERQAESVDELKKQCGHLETKRLYPWIVNIATYPSPGFIGELQRLAVALCIWIAPVVVLNIMSLSYIRRHAPFASYAMASLAFLGTVVVVFLGTAGRRRKSGQKQRVAYVTLGFLVAFEIFVLSALLPWAQNGAPVEKWSPWMRSVGNYAGRFMIVDLRNQKLVDEPKVDYPPNLRWQNLSYAHLEGADLTSAILKRADLSFARLNGATLVSAVLVGVDFHGAILRGANLRQAILEEADLRGAQLDGTNLQGVDLQTVHNLTVEQLGVAKTLYEAKLQPDLMRAIQERYPYLLKPSLQEAYLRGADFRGANFSGADFRRADLSSVNFAGAHLEGADFEEANLRASLLRGAFLSGANFTRANLGEVSLKHAILQEAILQEAFLVGALLDDADLRGAILRRADFRNAALRRTDLEAADLRGALITIDQLAEVKTLYETKLDAIY